MTNGHPQENPKAAADISTPQSISKSDAPTHDQAFDVELRLLIPPQLIERLIATLPVRSATLAAPVGASEQRIDSAVGPVIEGQVPTIEAVCRVIVEHRPREPRGIDVDSQAANALQGTPRYGVPAAWRESRVLQALDEIGCGVAGLLARYVPGQPSVKRQCFEHLVLTDEGDAWTWSTFANTWETLRSKMRAKKLISPRGAAIVRGSSRDVALLTCSKILGPFIPGGRPVLGFWTGSDAAG
jgi:hypothetical protein